MPPRKIRRPTDELYLRAFRRMATGSGDGKVEAAAPSRRVPDPRITQAQPAPAGGGPWAATLIVAASDSVHQESADFTCDGTDDQVEINDAIALLPNRGGRVLLLEGTYSITDSIQMIHWEMTLEGQGHAQEDWHWTGGATRLFVPNDTNAMFPIITDHVKSSTPPHPEGFWTGYAANLEPPYHPDNQGSIGPGRMGLAIKNLCIHGNGYNQSGYDATHFNHGIQWTNSTGNIENVTVIEPTGCGIVVFGAGNTNAVIRVKDCHVLGAFVHSYVVGLLTIVEGCSSDESGQDGYANDVYGAPYGAGIAIADSSSDVVVTGCIIRDCAGSGIRIVSDSFRIAIVGNVINGFSFNGSTALDYPGIICDGAGEGYQITGNVVWNGDGGGISVQSAGSPNASEIDIVGNYISDNGGPGIRLVYAENCNVKDNTLIADAFINYFGYDSPALYSGIQVEGDSYRNNIMGNIVRNKHVRDAHSWLTDYGITLDASTHDNWIVLNDLRDSGTAGSYQDLGTGNDDTSAGNLV